jgi:2-phosphosulfolactate phosphatase
MPMRFIQEQQKQGMQISYITHETCEAATGCVVVIDVWRSFTTASYAFAAGITNIIVTASPEEALALRLRHTGSLLMGMGELGGKPRDGFDFGNSPAELRGCDLRDRHIILCSPNGTPGLVRSVNARTLIAGSLVNARATVRYIKRNAPERVTFVCTEVGIADRACAEYMAALLQDKLPDSSAMLGAIRTAWSEHAIAMLMQKTLTEAQVDKLRADLECCLALDIFEFAMLVQRQDEMLIMQAISERAA